MNKTLFSDNNVSRIMGDTDVQIVDVRCSHEDYIKRQVTFQAKLGIDDPLLILDIDELVERYRKWYKLFPRVKLCYAMKCNNDEKIVDVLKRLGSSFDCASKAEIQQVLELGVDPSRIIYANPCKQNSHLTYAKEHNVDLMTFDTEEELIKVKMLYGSARLLMRFRPKNIYEVMYDLGKKFGCDFEEAMDLFISAKNKGLNVIGVCFHVGSNCLTSNAFASAIKEARRIFDIGLQIGFDMTVLDIGGGFRGRDIERPTIEENAEVINQCLDDYFPEAGGVKIIAEPGRYLVETAVSAAANIIGRKLIYDNDKTSIEHVMYNINDGAYGTFTWVKEGPEVFVMSPVLNKASTEKHHSTAWGPTCCGTDCLATDMPLPLMEVGKWVQISYAGAYSFSCSTNFNSMPRPKLYYFCSSDTWSSLVNGSLKISSIC
ncbi:ornithine decarboxylase-like isoform X1 [Mizuhopecten yessoensis]|uniref:ornithine decarboxylase n=3 Tax=Mizuhopecten yessoensis TaxID=6573 RepID=A0A210QIZ6_MIZYE|nr:ornithine decarboxylase-like isoform X1 [Mizuhopecten yessoensis]OWF48666.1 Ornithine decarboxylase [Mizuhopecten yessoensis]